MSSTTTKKTKKQRKAEKEAYVNEIYDELERVFCTGGQEKTLF